MMTRTAVAVLEQRLVSVYQGLKMSGSAAARKFLSAILSRKFVTVWQEILIVKSYVLC